MDKTSALYQTYLQILKEELIPAMGCTEPIAIAYAAAKAREVLGQLPGSVWLGVSNNIIKNVKSVIVPNTGGMKGIEAAAAAGIVAGQAGKALEVISEVTEAQKAEMRRFLADTPIRVEAVDNGQIFDIIVRLAAGEHTASVRIAQYHTNIVHVEKDGQILLDVPVEANAAACGHEGNAPTEDGLAGRDLLTIADILDFADTCDLADIRPVLDTQIQYNTQISEEGLLGDYGANIGSTMLKFYGGDVRNRAIAKAAAGSDARMSGCELPVVIAGCAAGCGIAYLQGADYEAIAHTLVNSLAIVSGIICDGAKPSCAAKIASSVEAGIMGYHMYLNGQQFRAGDGIVTKGVENTIRNVSQLGREGMRETDKEIVKIMMQES